jgi:hypothetical protein
MAGYIGARSVTLNTTVATAQDVTATDTTPEVTIINNTHEDSDSGREGKLIFKGQQSGGEESTLAEIEANHHGSSDDEAGQLIFRTNDGSDGASPTERLKIDSNGSILTATLGTDNVHLGEGAGDSITSGGNYNVAIGKDAGTALTTGDGNVAVGYEALKTEDADGTTTAVGYQALKTQNAGADSHNTAIGNVTGTAITTGVSNTIVGSLAGDALTVGGHNVAMGYEALSTDTQGSHSTAIGRRALKTQNFTSATDSHNTAIGNNAGTAITTGVQNTIVGSNAGDALTTGGLTAVGYLAGSAVETGVGNVFMGELAGTAVTSNNNTAVGSQALSSAVGGHSNACFGHDAGRLTTGSRNTCLGNDAGAAATGIDDCVLIGSGAGGGATLTGHDNIMVGSSAGSVMTSGAANVGVGVNALSSTTTHFGSTAMGHYAGFFSTADTNVFIGYLTGYGGGNTSIATSTGSGCVLVGSYSNASSNTSSGEIVLGHSLTGKGANTGFLGGPSGNYNAANSSAWNQTSDRRLKKNITNSSIGLAEINQIQVRNFEYKTKDDIAEIESDGLKETDIVDKSGVQVGAIAQELQAVLPKCVNEQSTGVLDLNTDNLTWHLVKAVQELSAKVDALETENTAIKSRLDALEAE